jgi:hypothetical protein
VLTPFCPRRAPCNGACLHQHEQLAWYNPPPHTAACPWHSPRLTPRAAEPPTQCDAPFTAFTHPLSVLNTPRVHTGHHTRTPCTRRWQCESRSDVGFSVSIKMVKSAWAGDVRWVCSRRGWTGTPPHPPPPGSQAVGTSCRFPLRPARTHPTRHRYTASTPRRRDTLECTCCSEGGSALRVRVRELPNSVVHNAALSPSCEHRWRHSSAR